MLRFCDSACRTARIRQQNTDRGAFAEFALGFNAPAVQLGDVLHNRQSKAGSTQFATARFVRAVKSFKDPRQIFGADSDPVIAHAERDRIAASFGGETDFTVLV